MVHAKLIGVEDCPWMNLLERDWKGDEDLMVLNYVLAVRNVVQDHPALWAIIRTPFLALAKEDPSYRGGYRSSQRAARNGEAKTKWRAR